MDDEIFADMHKLDTPQECDRVLAWLVRKYPFLSRDVVLPTTPDTLTAHVFFVIVWLVHDPVLLAQTQRLFPAQTAFVCDRFEAFRKFKLPTGNSVLHFVWKWVIPRMDLPQTSRYSSCTC